jgi:hypothetical protein
MGFYPVAVVLQKDTTHKNAHITQNDTQRSNKRNTQSYTNNKGHITHNEYNTKVPHCPSADISNIEE